MAPKLTKALMNRTTVEQFFRLPHEYRRQVKAMYPNRPLALGNEASPSKPSRIYKVGASNTRKVVALLDAAQKILSVLVAEKAAAEETVSSKGGDEKGDASKGDDKEGGAPKGGDEKGAAPKGGDERKESSDEGSSSGDSSDTSWEKKDGICVKLGCLVIPQGVTAGQIGKTFPHTANISPRGIRNPGTRCYRLALLQCLFHTPEFYHLLGILHKDCKKIPDECVTCAIQQMAEDYWNGNPKANDLNEDSDVLNAALKTMMPTDEAIQGDQQSDPYDIMLMFVRFLEWDAFGIDPEPVGFESEPFDPEDRNSHSMSTMFNLKYETRWTCTECTKKHPVRKDTEMGFDLDVCFARRSGDTLEQYLEDPRTNPFLDKSKLFCDSDFCKQKRQDPAYSVPEQTKTRALVSAPEILIIRLWRIRADYIRPKVSKNGKVKDGYFKSTKCTQVVNYGEQLDLSEYFVREEDDIRYQLRGVVSHIGQTIQYGHYIAGVARRGPGSGTYSIINNRKVRKATTDPKTLLSPPKDAHPWILVYSRIPPAATSDEESEEESEAS